MHSEPKESPAPHARGAGFGIFIGFVCFGAAALMLLLPAEGPPAWREEIDIDALAQLPQRASITADSAARWLRILDPSEQLVPYVRLSQEGLEIRADVEETWMQVPWSKIAEVKAPVDTSRPLQGVRVLLDPGHRGGGWSEAEERHLTIRDGPVVREGNLNWAVARLAMDALQRAGASVHLTRDAPPVWPPPRDRSEGFEPMREASIWLGRNQEDPGAHPWLGLFPSRVGRIGLERYKQGLAQTAFFELHNGWDLRRRAEAAGTWRADVTLSLHHNMAMRKDINKLIFFVPGNIMPGELETFSERFYALRRLLENDFDDALAVGQSISRSMHARLRMPAPPRYRAPKDGVSNRIPLDERAGLYARNLAILKRTPGLVLLLEGPCMNNEREYARLADRSITVDGEQYPKRVAQYATAVTQALVEQASMLQRRRILREQGL